MIPNFVSSAPSPFPVDPREDNVQRDHQLFLPNYQTASSSSVSCSVFFNPPQDQPEYYHVGMHQDQPQREDVNHAPYTGSHDPENKPNKGLKISLWKINENDQGDHHHHQENPVKWMSSKMRMMQKMKKYDITTKPEDQKQPTSSLETDHFSCNSSSNNSNPTPIRVCADCNTTKTPLWRSGPKGPKSLCNACGIRQRKARRALAAAATAANGTSPHYETTASLKIKVQNKEKTKNNGHMSTTQFKKRSKVITTGSSHHHAQQKNNVFEDFLFNLSKNLAFHRVFPQDEKEAAILLMALSCGLVHG